MSSPAVETDLMIEQQQLFVAMQRAKFSGDMETFQRIRRHLAMGGIRVEFDSNYRDKAQRPAGG